MCRAAKPFTSCSRVGAVAALALVLRFATVVLFSERTCPATRDNIVPEPEAVYLKTGDVKPGDSQQYLLLAENLRTKGRFSWDTAPVAFRTPGYPALLALLGNNLVLLVVVQAVLGGLTVVLLALLGARLFSPTTGLIAAVLLAVDPASIFYSGVVMTETLFLVLLVAATYLFVVRREWAAGLLLGGAVLTRPIAMLVFGPYAVALAVRRRWLRLAALLGMFALLPGLWLARNLVVFKRVGLSSISGYNLFYYNAGALVAAERGISGPEARRALGREFAAQLATDNPLAISAALTREAVRIISHDPVRYGLVYLVGLGHILAGVKADDIVLRIVRPELRLAPIRAVGQAGLNPGVKLLIGGLAVGELVLVLGALGLAVAGMALGPGRQRRLFLVALAGYFLLAAAPVPDARFRLPAMPFVYLAAASAGQLFRVRRPGS